MGLDNKFSSTLTTCNNSLIKFLHPNTMSSTNYVRDEDLTAFYHVILSTVGAAGVCQMLDTADESWRRRKCNPGTEFPSRMVVQRRNEQVSAPPYTWML